MRSSIYLATLACSALAASASAQFSAIHPVQNAKAPIKHAAVPTTPPSGSTHTSFVGGSDNCMTPDLITGPGTYAVNTTAATTGSPVASCGLMSNDVWFAYTAASTSSCTVTACAGIGGSDSVFAAWTYAGAGLCPTTQIACNDDTCGLESKITFPVTIGTTYMLELGGFNGNTYSGNFFVTESPPIMNDGCASPTTVIGNGPFPFDTTGSTTGIEGQTEQLCNFYSSTPINNDVWFTWVATASGTVNLDLCNGGAGYDSKMAVYPGAGCPASGTAIACNDDFCGLVSSLCFQATLGNTYTIQIGAYASGVVGNGTFMFTPLGSPTSACSPEDDGSSENSVGLNVTGDIGWMVQYGLVGQSTQVSAVSVCYGTPLYPGGFTPTGPITICVWDDPNDDGNPTDGVLVSTIQVAASPASIDTDVFQTVNLPTPVTLNGLFFVGAVAKAIPGQFVAPLDQSSSNPCGGASWVFYSTPLQADIHVLTNNTFPPGTTASIGLPGNWLVRATCGPGVTGTPFCFGDGSSTACPCGNVGATGHGCENSFTTGGALLTANGNPSVASDSVQLQGSNFPPTTTCLFFQGNAQANGGLGAVFGDGLRCATTAVKRLGTRPVTGGVRNFGAGVSGDPLISVQGAVPVTGGTREYQAWYRNAASFCTVSTFNLSNGLQIVWTP